MDKYRRVEQKTHEESVIKETEIRITTQGKPRNFISYATTLFKEKNVTEVVLKAMGRAISKTVTIAEIIKRRIPNLHQLTVIDSTDITDVWEPLEEGLDRVETTRHVSSITITLSIEPLDTTAPGYQAPLPEDQVKEITIQPKVHRTSMRGRGRYPRGGGRGGQFQDGRARMGMPPPARPYRGARRGGGRGRHYFHENVAPADFLGMDGIPTMSANGNLMGNQGVGGFPGYRTHQGGNRGRRGAPRGRGRGRGGRRPYNSESTFNVPLNNPGISIQEQ